MEFEVRIENTGESFRCIAGQNVLKAMEQLCRKGIPVGCRNGGCGGCQVRGTGGRYSAQEMSRACRAGEEEAQGVAPGWRIVSGSELEGSVRGRVGSAVRARGR